MNDYPPERIICDIVELLQDLKAQGYISVTTLHASGSVAVDLLDSTSAYKKWIEGANTQAYSGYVNIGIDSNKYAQDLLVMYNSLHDFKDLAEHHAQVEKMLCTREYIIENLTERAA